MRRMSVGQKLKERQIPRPRSRLTSALVLWKCLLEMLKPKLRLVVKKMTRCLFPTFVLVELTLLKEICFAVNAEQSERFSAAIPKLRTRLRCLREEAGHRHRRLLDQQDSLSRHLLQATFIRHRRHRQQDRPDGHNHLLHQEPRSLKRALTSRASSRAPYRSLQRPLTSRASLRAPYRSRRMPLFRLRMHAFRLDLTSVHLQHQFIRP
mmetsp:Transcript_2869/g.4837  ORF Transcript_2869/g.4837 Transcript_2869/m.4837 type:complete len:208 (-) Transcript_2869:282-905(-)